MSGGTIFVLCLAAAFLVFAIYLAQMSRLARREQEEAQRKDIPPLKKAG
jgi:hypothetical protein